jgi:integrase
MVRDAWGSWARRLNHIEAYLTSKANSWAASTLRSEGHRLRHMAPALDGNPDTLWNALAPQAPYTRLTSWTRATSYWQWLIDQGHASGPNLYTKFKRDNGRLFKNVYQPRHPTITFEEAAKRVQSITHPAIRSLALRMLGDGTRYSEAIQRGEVILGKGAKYRTRFSDILAAPAYDGSYSLFRSYLASKGLKPHDLRKLLATKLVSAGLKEADLLKVMGWSSMETAKYYLQPKRDEELRDVFSAIQKELL